MFQKLLFVTDTDTLLCVYKIVKINIFFRPEEAMFENWQKLVYLLKNFVWFLRICKLHSELTLKVVVY